MARSNDAKFVLQYGFLHQGNIRGERECWADRTDSIATQVYASWSDGANPEDVTFGSVNYKRYKLK